MYEFPILVLFYGTSVSKSDVTMATDRSPGRTSALGEDAEHNIGAKVVSQMASIDQALYFRF